MLVAHKLLRGTAQKAVLVRHNSTGRGSSSRGTGRFLFYSGMAFGAGSTAAVYFLDIPIGESIDSLLPKGWTPLFHKAAIERHPVLQPLVPRMLPQSPDTRDLPMEVAKPKIEAPEKPKIELKPPVTITKKKQTPKELEESLVASLKSAETRVRNATSAKNLTIDRIDDHVRAIKTAIEAGPNGDWSDVTTANEAVLLARREDRAAESDARNFVTSLRLLTNSSTEALASNPILSSAMATAAKLEKELDEMAFSVKMLESEQIFALEYADLVAQARGRFANELRAVLPSFDWDGESKMKKAQLNALLTHAHIRLDQLQRKSIEQRLREESRIEAALKKEIEKRDDVIRGELAMSEDHEAELHRRLEVAEREHEARIDQMVRSMRDLHRIELQQQVQEAVTVERQVHASKLAAAQCAVEGIEEALSRRVALDAENRRAKQTWLACYSLLEAVEHGRKGALTMEKRRRPVGDEINVLEKVSDGDLFVAGVAGALGKRPKEDGEYTRADMETRFEKVYRLGRRVAYVDERGAGLWGYVVSAVRSAVTFAFPYKGTEKLDWSSMDNVALLDTARVLVKEKKYKEAARLLALLEGESKRVASSWAVDLRSLEESLFLVRLLLAHSALQSVRSTY